MATRRTKNRSPTFVELTSRRTSGAGPAATTRRLRKARDVLADFGDLWRDPDVPDRLREAAVHELFERFDVDGSRLMTAHPRRNENAWLLGQAAMRDGSLVMSEDVGMVGARGVKPTLAT